VLLLSYPTVLQPPRPRRRRRGRPGAIYQVATELTLDQGDAVTDRQHSHDFEQLESVLQLEKEWAFPSSQVAVPTSAGYTWAVSEVRMKLTMDTIESKLFEFGAINGQCGDEASRIVQLLLGSEYENAPGKSCHTLASALNFISESFGQHGLLPIWIQCGPLDYVKESIPIHCVFLYQERPLCGFAVVQRVTPRTLGESLSRIDFLTEKKIIQTIEETIRDKEPHIVDVNRIIKKPRKLEKKGYYPTFMGE
jgi:hypothetical protein